MLNVIVLRVIMLSVIMLSVVMLSVIMVSVVAPFCQLYPLMLDWTYNIFEILFFTLMKRPSLTKECQLFKHLHTDSKAKSA
jgi:hypothetical protein